MAGVPSDGALIELLDDLQVAALRPGHWDSVLQRLAELLGADTAGVQVRSAKAKLGGPVEGIGSLPAGWSPQAWSSYTAHYQHLDPVSAGAVRLGPKATFRTSDIVAMSELRETEFWCDWAHPNGLDWLMATSMQIDGDSYAALGLCRALRRGEFSLEQASWLARVTPHLERAIQIQRRLHAAESDRDGLAAVVDRLAVGIFLLDEAGRLVRLNKQAEQLLAEADGLACVNGRLIASRPNEHPALERLIRDAASASRGQLAAPGGSVALSRRRAARLQLLVAPLSLRAQRDGAVVVFATDPESAVGPPAEWLIGLYALTPSEARVASLIASGLSLAGAAVQLERSVETLRRQLKVAMQKLGVRRQAELVKVVLSSPRLRHPD